MAKKREPTDRKQHEFTKMPEFDEAMRKLVEVPKEEVAKREESERTPREK